MKKLVVVFSVALLLTGLSGFSVFSDQKVWVTSTDAQLKADSTSSSGSVANLGVGAELTVIQYKNRWYQVKTSKGTKGWIYRGKVSTSPPSEETKKSGAGGIGNLLGNLSGSDVQANSADSSRSIRGLSPEAEEYAKQSGTPQQHKQALDNVIALKTQKAQIEQFLKNGKIGEYAQ